MVMGVSKGGEQGLARDGGEVEGGRATREGKEEKYKGLPALASTKRCVSSRSWRMTRLPGSRCLMSCFMGTSLAGGREGGRGRKGRGREGKDGEPGKPAH